MELVVVALAVRLICPAIKHNASAEHRETHVPTRCVKNEILHAHGFYRLLCYENLSLSLLFCRIMYLSPENACQRVP